MSDAKNTVLQAAAELFGDKDPTAVDRWVAADYKQHSALAPDGPEALRGLVAGLGEDFRYEGARVIADGTWSPCTAPTTASARTRSSGSTSSGSTPTASWPSTGTP
jgi:predicted SnoaL-like aldol condensation-catalyzing enzyme